MTKTTDDLDDVPRPDTTGSHSPERQVELEERVRKLETALAERGTPALMEETVADRVIAKLSAAASPHSPVGSDRVLVLASTHDAPPPPPKGAVLRPPQTSTDLGRHTWFLSQLGAEIRLAVHMYFDPRYRISRTTQFALPGIALILLFNYFFFTMWASIAFVSPFAERLLDVVFCVIGYKLLTRELGRYREVLDYLSRYGIR
jgi:hypothetical protein